MNRTAIRVAMVAGAMSIASAAAAQEPMYVTHMYSDATNTVEVGTITPQCSFRPGQGYYVQYTQTGTYTYFQVDELVGYCPDAPIE